MPQMFPMNWLLMFTVFSTLMISTSIHTYFTFNQPSYSTKIKFISPMNNWQW